VEGAAVVTAGARLGRWGNWLRNVFAATGAVVLLCMATPVGYWWATWLAGPWDDPGGDVLIVLGASVEDQRVISVDTYRRSLYAVLAWRGGGFRKVVVCGNGPAELMKEFLVFSGIPAAAIVTESRSLSTRENAFRVSALLAGEPGRKVLLTSDFHMFRAHRVFRKARIDVIPRPIPDARSRWLMFSQRWGAIVDLGLESVKIGYYWAKGWI
jgi:uncharacterized SAM-binding protein YcdF (DUF218 family)